MATPAPARPVDNDPPGFLEAVAVGALSAGVNPPTFLALNAALLAVVLTLCATLALAHGGGRRELVPHLLALLVLATGLWALLVWLVTTVGFADARKQRRELLFEEEDQEEEKREEEAAAATAAAPTAAVRRRRRDGA
jgi:type VI protein secretion system component VasK